MKCTRILCCWIILLSSIFIMQSCTTKTKANEVVPIGKKLSMERSSVKTVEAKPVKADQTLKWHSINEIEQLQSEAPRKIIVDVYTDWCRWCKVMDQKTFTDPTLIAYLNQHYYMVKFNAEQKTEATFKGKTYQYRSNGVKGFNGLAAELTQGKMSYPSFVVLDEKLNTLQIERGFKSAPQFKQALATIKPI